MKIVTKNLFYMKLQSLYYVTYLALFIKKLLYVSRVPTYTLIESHFSSIKDKLTCFKFENLIFFNFTWWGRWSSFHILQKFLNTEIRS